jgi:hypothetical protein
MKKLGFDKLVAICFLTFLVGIFVAESFEPESVAYDVIGDISMYCLLGGFVFAVLHLRGSKAEREERKADREAWEADIAQRVAAREKESGWTDWRDHDKAEKYIKQRERKAVLEKEAFERAEARRPVSAVLISTNSKRSGVDAAGRAIVGGVLLGPLGAVAGAVTGTSKATKATFSVKYGNGDTGVETVDINGKRFRELSAAMHN